ncbi:origin recognition complex subunit 2 domain containing protein [Naviculisporaceae sp. PSN 640]
MPRRSTSKKEANRISLGSPQKRTVPYDPYEIPDEDGPAKKRSRTSLKQRDEPAEKEQDGQDQDDGEQDEEDANLRGGESESLPKSTRRGRPPGNDPVTNGEVSTPTTSRTKNVATVETPSRKAIDTPSRRNIADRSARRKSARALIDRVVNDALSDDEQEDEGIAREIYESSEDEDEDDENNQQPPQEEDDEEEDEEEEPAVAPTPTKRRGRPPGSGKKPQQTRKRSPTPPGDLPPHEQYFYQNKPGRPKTSNNTLSSLELLTHDEYFSLLRQTKDPHANNIQFLESLHAKSFAQWYFELSQGFTTCLFGYGSKRRLMHQFATYISTKTKNTPRIVIINGYLKTLTIREILITLGSAIDPSTKIPSTNPQTMVTTFLRLLNSSASPSNLYIIINSIDAAPLRKPTVQSILSQLAAHPRIRLVCSADTPDFPLLWDSGLRSSFNFVFHDCTTFAPLAGPAGSEIEVVDEVHELLGRMARRVGGKEGVTFVLRSLPENAKNLFRLLVTEVLVSMDDGNESAEGVGIEYRMMYNKAVEEFICSSEMAFRTLLKEFHDHQIIESHKDSIGTELLSLPFRKDELESILEDLMS